MSELTVTVYVVDDDTSHLHSIERLLRAAGYAVTCFQSAADFLAHQPRQAAGCVLVDLQMPAMDGIALQKALAESDNPMPVVFLTGQGDIPSSVAAMRLGAEDFLAKTAPKEDLLAAIDRAIQRDSIEREQRANKSEVLSQFRGLTPRENQVLTQVLRGRLNKQIAGDLGVTERSVKRHRSSLMRKLKVESVAELVRLAVEAGINSGNEPE